MLLGGWRENYPGGEDKEALRDAFSIRDKLHKDMGITPKNVISFVTNGELDRPRPDILPGTWQPAAGAYSKQLFRQRLEEYCAKPSCTDLLLIYLKNVATPEGTMLLWDMDGDSEANSEEYLTLHEFIQAVKTCGAREVVILADQNGGAQFYRRLRFNLRHGKSADLKKFTVVTAEPAPAMRRTRRSFQAPQMHTRAFKPGSLLTQKFLNLTIDPTDLHQFRRKLTDNLSEFLIFDGTDKSNDTVKRFSRGAVRPWVKSSRSAQAGHRTRFLPWLRARRKI
ncbi:hypothetical protein Ciccas_010795 [Cichlidogyrus casuarinus]|uniref:Uncharacterized protein n=1 Tax=Cichlidogyrus casuarinus TaxID=1844966 RepID=A0ABD2PT35_9PLAT